MREIKFRAWNKGIGWKNKDGSPCEPKMEYKGFIMYPETGLCEFPQGGWDIGGYTEKPESFILMQFTGLKDKNGKEIYEGDIVRFISPSFYSGGEGIIEFEAGEYVARKVSTKEPGSLGYLWFSEDADTSIGYTSKNEREVIGNIYENPDLLQGNG